MRTTRKIRRRHEQNDGRDSRRGSRRTASAIGAAALIAASAATLMGPAGAATAATSSPVAQTLSTATASSETITIVVPAGVTPQRVVGQLVVARTVPGRVTFSVRNHVAAVFPTGKTRPIAIPVTAADLTADRTLPLTMTYRATAACPDGTGTAPITFRSVRLGYTGAESVATSVGRFFPPSPSLIDVVVAPTARDDVLAAGLTAVAALSSRFSDQTRVHLTTSLADLPAAGLGQRVVRIVPGTGDARAAVGVVRGKQTLTLAGSGTALSAAAQALGSPGLSLADAKSISGLSTKLQNRTASLTHSLADLGFDSIELQTPSPTGTFIGVQQDTFGGPVDSMKLHFTGTHTVVPAGTQLQVNTYVNDVLVDSQLLDGSDPKFTIDATADGSLVRSDNGIQVTLATAGPRSTRAPSTSGATNACAAVAAGGTAGADAAPGGTSGLPVQLFIDGDDSSITATRGAGSMSGFSMFPQVLAGQLPIAIRGTGTARVAEAVDASYIVSSLQRSAAAPLQVSLVDADDFVGGNQNGLLVGATEADSNALGAPLRYSQVRLLDYAEAQFKVGTNQPYAALEALEHDGRHVLMLGGWSPKGDASALLTRRAALATTNWTRLSNDLLIASGTSQAFAVSSNAVTPQAAVTDEQRSFIWWLVGAVVLLLLIVLFQVVRTRSRDREVRVLVDAQETGDGGDARG